MSNKTKKEKTEAAMPKKMRWNKELGRPFRVFINASENSGVGYFREYLPAVALRENGLAEVMINDFRWGVGDHVEMTEKVFFEICNWADIALVGRLDLPQFYAKWGAAKEFFNLPIVLDTDDNVHNVRPTNPGYQGYHPGSNNILWNDFAMKNIFDAMSVTTTGLKDYYSKYHPRIYVLPNSLDLKEWEKYKRKPHDGKIRMTFMCSGAHSEGFGMIMDSVHKILRKYPQVEFYFQDMYWRLVPKPDDIKDRMMNIPWIPLKDWAKTMKEYGFDIGLAPLRDNLFNRSKSNLRYLEYSAAGMASIVSPVEPYKMVNDRVDGIIAHTRDDWYNGMEKLILEEESRKKISQAAYARVKKEYNIDKNAKLWLQVLEEVYEKFHDFKGPKKKFMDISGGKYREIKPRRWSQETEIVENPGEDFIKD